MSELLDPTVFRGVERLITVIFAGLSMYWGFRLFDRVYQNSGELEAKGASFSINLRKVGPGIFFALFGMAILISGITSKLDHSTQRPVAQLQPAAPTASAASAAAASFETKRSIFGQGGMMSGKENRILDLIGSTKITIAFLQRLKSSDQGDRDIHITQLRGVKAFLLDELFTPEGIQEFKELRAKIAKDPSIYNGLSTEARGKYDQIRDVSAEL